MAQFRNVTDDVLYTVTPQGLVRVEPDSVLTVADDFAAERYWQDGSTGEPRIWERVDAPRGKSTAKKESPTTESADAAEEE